LKEESSFSEEKEAKRLYFFCAYRGIGAMASILGEAEE
jgi:hypothetical protein